MKYKIIISAIFAVAIAIAGYVYISKQNEKLDDHSLVYAKIFTVLAKCKDVNRAGAGKWLNRIKSAVDKEFNDNKFQDFTSRHIVSHFMDYEIKGNDYWCQYTRGYLWARGVKGVMPDVK